MSQPTYDRLGADYVATRRADPRIAALIVEALGDARTVVNVGAGAGAYEPTDRRVVAVEPSRVMIAQRHAKAARVIEACAESLPYADRSFDAGMAILTVHHWRDQERGLAELRRVARARVVVMTFDPAFSGRFWLADYLPALVEVDRQQMRPIDLVGDWLGGADVVPVPIPGDCTDGFLAAYWRRPACYLDARVRANISSFARIPDATIDAALERLERDILSGAWRRRYGALEHLDAFDAGYRLLIGSGSAG